MCFYVNVFWYFKTESHYTLIEDLKEMLHLIRFM